jgi:prevent-host-death family protein
MCTLTGSEPHVAAAHRPGRTTLCNRATLSHMEIGVREPRNRTSQVIDAVQAGERVTLTVHGEPVADIVPHGRRARWLSGGHLRDQLRERAADPALTHDLDDLAGQTLDEL